MDVIHRQYYGITITYVQEYCSACPVCQLSQPQSTRAPLKPTIESDISSQAADGSYWFFATLQMNTTTTLLILWIIVSKFHILFPTKTKEADEVATLFKERVLAYFGAPVIFHSDNGREFCNQVLTNLLKNSSYNVTFVHGRPRHSRSQGLVQRGNREDENRERSP